MLDSLKWKYFWSVQAVFSLLFRDDQYAKRYHKEHNDDPYAEVSDWTSDGMRTVKFSATINAPKVLKKFVGEFFSSSLSYSTSSSVCWDCYFSDVPLPFVKRLF
jgi:hypothetical protein